MFGTVWVPGGRALTAATLAQMRSLARGAVTDPMVVWAARRIAATAGDGHADDLVAQWIRAYLQAHVRYASDPVDRELLVKPADMIREIDSAGSVAGDCDDTATLGAALALAVGLPAIFRAVAVNGDPEYSHVYAIIPTMGGGVSLDLQSRPVGVTVTRRLDYPV